MAIADLETHMTDSGIQRYECLQERVLLVAPEIGYWRGQYQIRDAEVRIGGTATDKEAVTRPQTKLLECSETMKKWKDRFQELNTDKKRLCDRYTRTFPGIAGVRMLPRNRAAEFFDLLIGPVSRNGTPIHDAGRPQQSLAYRVGEVADEFCEAYEGLLVDMERSTPPEIWKRVRDLLPNQDKMRSKFYLDITPVELAGTKGQRISREDIDQYNDLIRDSTMRRVDEAIEEMIAGPRSELAKAIGELHDLIKRDGRVRANSFNPVREAIEKVRMFSFIANDDLLEQIGNLERRLDNTTAATLNSTTAANNGFLTAIESVRGEIEDARKQAADFEEFGRNFRGITLED